MAMTNDVNTEAKTLSKEKKIRLLQDLRFDPGYHYCHHSTPDAAPGDVCGLCEKNQADPPCKLNFKLRRVRGVVEITASEALIINMVFSCYELKELETIKLISDSPSGFSASKILKQGVNS